MIRLNAFFQSLYFRRLVWTVAVATCAQPLAAQDLVTDFKAGPASGRYSFASSTPRLLPELFKSLGSASDVNIVGHLFMPPGANKVPSVILMHGSGGVYDAMLGFWPRYFNAAGIAVFSIDSFGPRGVKTTAEDQTQVPFAADTADAYAALRILATHPRIDVSRIALMGFSRGGITTWRSALERVIKGQAGGENPRFAAYVPVYSGGCTGLLRVQAKAGVFGATPMMWVHGDADDYTPIGPCKALADQIRGAGTPVEFVTIAGAHHKFDQDDQRRTLVKSAVRSLDTCTLEFDVDSLSYNDAAAGQKLSIQEAQALNKSRCAALGANVEGSTRARDEAAHAILGFFRKTIAR